MQSVVLYCSQLQCLLQVAEKLVLLCVCLIQALVELIDDHSAMQLEEALGIKDQPLIEHKSSAYHSRKATSTTESCT